MQTKERKEYCNKKLFSSNNNTYDIRMQRNSTLNDLIQIKWYFKKRKSAVFGSYLSPVIRMLECRKEFGSHDVPITASLTLALCIRKLTSEKSS